MNGASPNEILRHFSPRAGRVLGLARVRAGRRGAGVVDLNDLIAAIVLEDQGRLESEFGGAGEVKVRNPKTSPPVLTVEQASVILARSESGKVGDVVSAEEGLPPSHDMARVLTAAFTLMNYTNQQHIHPLHLLIAALDDPNQTATLRNAGVARDLLIAAVASGEYNQ